jgi:hypothetical protein
MGGGCGNMISLSEGKTVSPLIILKCMRLPACLILQCQIQNKFQNVTATKNSRYSINFFRKYFFKEQSYMIFLAIFEDFFAGAAQKHGTKAGIAHGLSRRFRSGSYSGAAFYRKRYGAGGYGRPRPVADFRTGCGSMKAAVFPSPLNLTLPHSAEQETRKND